MFRCWWPTDSPSLWSTPWRISSWQRWFHPPCWWGLPVGRISSFRSCWWSRSFIWPTRSAAAFRSVVKWGNCALSSALLAVDRCRWGGYRCGDGGCGWRVFWFGGWVSLVCLWAVPLVICFIFRAISAGRCCGSIVSDVSVRWGSRAWWKL